MGHPAPKGWNASSPCSGCSLHFTALLQSCPCPRNWFPGKDVDSGCSMKFSRTESNFLIPFFLHEARKCLNNKEIEQWNGEKQGNPSTLSYFLISCIQIEFRPRHAVKAGGLALTLTVTLFCVQTGAGSENWSWQYNLTYLLDNSSTEQHPSVLPWEAPNPNILQTLKSGSPLLLLKEDFGPEMTHMAPSWSFSLHSPCTERAPPLPAPWQHNSFKRDLLQGCQHNPTFTKKDKNKKHLTGRCHGES